MNEENNLSLREKAEILIRTSRTSHEENKTEEECSGCNKMRLGLEILSELGDPTIYST